MAHKFNTPVFPHAGGVGLCEYVQHLCMIDYILINGEKETGITTFFINEDIDSGLIIMQEKIELSKNMTAAQLHNRLIKSGNIIPNKTIHAIHNNLIHVKFY